MEEQPKDTMQPIQRIKDQVIETAKLKAAEQQEAARTAQMNMLGQSVRAIPQQVAQQITSRPIEVNVASGDFGKLAESIGTAISMAKGDKGEKGIDGKDGRDGKDGENGKDGIDGVIGRDGKDGRHGKDGKDGYTPIKGIDYTDGKDGAKGAKGAKGGRGLKGDKGRDGFSSFGIVKAVVAGTGITVDNTDQYNPIVSATSTGGGMADPGANGILSRTALDTTAARTITGTTNQVTVTNGDGVSGNPTLSLPSAITTPGTLTTTGVLSPSADSTYTLGTSSLYWSNTYTDRLYFNSTAYLDGGTAGTLRAIGTLKSQHPTGNTIMYIESASGQNRAELQLKGHNASNDNDFFSLSIRTDFADAVCYVYDASAGAYHNMFYFDYLNDKITLLHTAISDGKNMSFGATTGTKIGTSTTQKLGFFNATPVVQPSATPVDATDLATALTLVNDLKSKLVTLGLIA